MEPGEWGRIHVTPRKGMFVARVRVRDQDGRRRLVECQGKSADDARRKLQQRIMIRQLPTGTGILKSTSSVSDLAQYWFAEKSASVSKQTLDSYRDTWSRICEPELGELRIREVRTSTLDAFFKRTAKIAPSRSRAARTVCSGMFSLAVRLDLLPANPVTDTRTQRRKNRTSDIRAVSLDEFLSVRDAIGRYCGSVALPAGTTRMGPKPSADLEDVLTMLISTGARIGEVLALRWTDVYFDVEPACLVINGTIVVPRFKGDGLYRQDYRKGNAPPLTITLPKFAVDVLRRRLAAQNFADNPTQAVFVTSTGNWMSPSNVRRAWRAALGEDLAWVTPHTMRKTVATAIKKEYGVEGAQVQLGHSDSRVTEAHYIQRLNVAPDMTSALITFAPSEDESDE